MNSDITMFRFIVLHYFSGDAKYGDYDRDQELPFKKNHCTEISISFVVPPDGISEPVLKSFPILKNVVPSSQEFITSSFHFSIWQPPRA